MLPVKFEGANVNFKAPKDWDHEKDGPCLDLPVHADGVNCISVWKPSAEELQALNAGQNITLTVVGRQPPVMLSVDGITGDVIDPLTQNQTMKAAFKTLIASTINEMLVRNVPLEWAPNAALGIAFRALGCESVTYDDAAKAVLNS